jgi:polysaccharide export outer membrane protein
MVADPLKPGDRLLVTVAGFPELSGEQTVTTNGSIQVPLAGTIEIAGLTPQAAVAPIVEALRPYVRRPQVSLTVISLSPMRLTVAGAVNQPGPRTLELSTANGALLSPPTLSGALAQAGGIMPNADLRNVVIYRQGNPKNRLQVDLWEAIQSGDLQADVRIYDGDEIRVPALQGAPLDQRTLLSSTAAPQTITVQVGGEVNRPGQIEISSFAGVTGAVAAAGGPAKGANFESVMLLRMDAQGQVSQQTFALGESSIPLMDGDVLYVSPSGSERVAGAFDWLYRIFRPFGQFFDVIRINN